MELFEEAPADADDWGDIVDMDEKLFESSNDGETSDSDNNDNIKTRNDKKMRVIFKLIV